MLFNHSMISWVVALFVHDRLAYAVSDTLMSTSSLVATVKVAGSDIYSIHKSNSNSNCYMFKMVLILIRILHKEYLLILDLLQICKPNENDVMSVIQCLLEHFSFGQVLLLDSLSAANFCPDKYSSSSVFNYIICNIVLPLDCQVR